MVLSVLSSKTASASVHSAWTPVLPAGYEVLPVCLPGSPVYPRYFPSAVPHSLSRFRRSCCRSRLSAPVPGKILFGKPVLRLRRLPVSNRSPRSFPDRRPPKRSPPARSVPPAIHTDNHSRDTDTDAPAPVDRKSVV